MYHIMVSVGTKHGISLIYHSLNGISAIYYSMALLISTTGVVYLGLCAAAGVICGIIGRQSVIQYWHIRIMNHRRKLLNYNCYDTHGFNSGIES